MVTSVLLSRGSQTEVNYSLTGPISDCNSLCTVHQHRIHHRQTGNFRECSVRESQSEINGSQTTCRCSSGQLSDCTTP